MFWLVGFGVLYLLMLIGRYDRVTNGSYHDRYGEIGPSRMPELLRLECKNERAKQRIQERAKFDRAMGEFTSGRGPRVPWKTADILVCGGFATISATIFMTYLASVYF